MTDMLVVGGGLAGACAALWMSEHGSVTVLEADRPAAGASGAAAGLVNPFMGHKAKPAWRYEAALDALHASISLTGQPGLFRSTGLLRPARDARQADAFRARPGEHPVEWLSVEHLHERYPDLEAPHGGLWIPQGGSVDLSRLVGAFLRAAEQRGALVRTDIRVTGWLERPDRVTVSTDSGEAIEARRVLLALGDGFRHFDVLRALPLHRIKGQTIRVRRPADLGDLPALSGFGYVVPDRDTLVIGSSYEHDFDDLSPSKAQSEALVAKAARMVPKLAGADILEARAGVRVTVPRSHSPRRLPLVGPVPNSQRVWMLTGLGSKGLLTAPFLARHLPRWLDDPEQIPAAVRTPS